MIVILYGVHGDETKATDFASKELEKAIRQQEADRKVIRVGPISKWSSRYSRHFDRDGSDPNRANKTTWKQTSDGRVERVAEEIRRAVEQKGYIDGDSVRCALNDLGIIPEEVMRSAQTQRRDFPCYVSKPAWNQARRKRRIIERKIGQATNEEEPIVTVIDVHAGIGRSGEVNIAWKKSRRDDLDASENGYLAEGLLSEIKNVQRSIIIEVGTIGTKEMEKQILNELVREKSLKVVRNSVDNVGLNEWRTMIRNGVWEISLEILKMV